MDEILLNVWIASMAVMGLFFVAIIVFWGGLKRSRSSSAQRELSSRTNCATAFCATYISRLESISVKARLAIVFLQIYCEFLVTTDFLTSSGINGAALTFITSGNLGGLTTFFRIGCASVDVNFYSSLLAVTLWPLAVLALMGLTALCFRWRGNYDAALGWAIWLGLELLFIVYSSVSAQIVRAFLKEPFERFEGDTDPFETLQADHKIDFASTKSAHFRAYAGIMIAVYPIGTALLFFGLWFKQKSLGPVWKRASNFLWTPYKERVGFYESIELARRFVLTSGFVLLTQTHAAIAVVCFVAFVSFFLSVVQVVKPYDDSRTGGVISNQHFAQLMLILLLLLGLCGLTHSLVTESRSAKTLQSVVIALGCLGAALSIFAILAELRASGSGSDAEESGQSGLAEDASRPFKETPSETKAPSKGISIHLPHKEIAPAVDLLPPATPMVYVTNVEILDTDLSQTDAQAPQNTPEEETFSIARAASLEDCRSTSLDLA